MSTERGIPAQLRDFAGIKRELALATWRKLGHGPADVWLMWNDTRGFRTAVGKLHGKTKRPQFVGVFTRKIDLQHLHEDLNFAASQIEV